MKYKTLHNKYICEKCCDKANEIINFISKIYDETIYNYLSISPKFQHLCKIYIKVLNITIPAIIYQ